MDIGHWIVFGIGVVLLITGLIGLMEFFDSIRPAQEFKVLAGLVFIGAAVGLIGAAVEAVWGLIKRLRK